jgi:hypothetical protein
MKAFLLFVVAATLLGPAAWAADPAVPKQSSSSPVAECLRLATEKGLNGTARDQFLRECVPARLKPGAPNPTAEPADPPIHC